MTRAAEGDTFSEAVLTAWSGRCAALEGLADMLAAHAAEFTLSGGHKDLNIGCRQPVRGRPNRCHMRLSLCDNNLLAVVFYRTSGVEGGGQFGYGGAAVPAGRLRPDQVQSWLDYVASGFDAGTQPRGVRAEFQYPVPE